MIQKVARATLCYQNNLTGNETIYLDDDEQEEGKEEGEREVQHHLVVVRPGDLKWDQNVNVNMS